MTATTKDEISLKWGSLKSWNIHSEECLELLKKWHKLGVSASAMSQHDTPEQKELICQLIDKCSAETIHLDWDGIDVSKDDAKKYVMEYGQEKAVPS